MSVTPAKNPSRRRASSALALPATLLALACATALIPATASAADDQGIGAHCIQVIPGVYIDLGTGATCDPTEASGAGEIIEIHDPYKACPPGKSRCGLPDGGRAPVRSEGADEKGFGSGPTGRGRRTTPTKQIRRSAKESTDRLILMAKCAKLMKAGEFLLEDVMPGGRIRPQKQLHSDWVAADREGIALLIPQLFNGNFASTMKNMENALRRVRVGERTIEALKMSVRNLTDDQLEARRAFFQSGCAVLVDEDY